MLLPHLNAVQHKDLELLGSQKLVNYIGVAFWKSWFFKL